MMRRNGILALAVDFYTVYLGFAAPSAITSGRARALVAAAVGLISLIIGAFALARSTGRVWSMGALVVGLIGTILSVVHLSTSGGFGTGGGRAGAIVGLVLALIGMILGGLALARSHLLRS